MTSPLARAKGSFVVVALGALGACSPGSDTPSLGASAGHLLPAEVIDTLPDRRMNVVWAPELSACAVCNAAVSEALRRFAEDYPEADVVTALVAGAPFPEELQVGRKVVVVNAKAAEPLQDRRPYLAILDADHRLLGWRRIPELGRQEDFVYQELLGAYSLTAPLE